MGRYTVGPSTVNVTGTPAQPGDVIEHDFSIDGPEGEHGPAREAALIAAGALTPITEKAVGERASGSRRAATTDTQE